ncbi:MAG: caspase family protein [Bacteroidetes bacterium]|nr:caspase family protein [Bacteroidota bacterium]
MILRITLVLLVFSAFSYCQIPAIKLSIGHGQTIDDVCYSWDEKMIASISNGEIKVWDVASQKEIKTVSLGSGYLGRILFSRDGQKIICSVSKFEKNEEAKLIVIDIFSGQIKLVNLDISIGLFTPYDMVISSNGEYLAVTSRNYFLLLNAQNYAVIKSIRIPNISTYEGGVVGMAFNQNLTEIYIGIYKGELIKYDMSRSRLISETLLNPKKPERISFAPQVDKFIVANSDYSFELWSISEKKLIETIYKPEFSFSAVDINKNDGTILISGTNDKMIRVFSPKIKKPILLGPHNTEVQVAKFSPSGNRIVAANSSWRNKSERNGLKEWDASKGDLIGEYGIGFPRKDVLLISESTMISKQLEKVIVWNFLTNKIGSHNLPSKHSNVLALNADSIYTVCPTGIDSKYVIYDVVRGKTLLSFDLNVPIGNQVELWMSKNGELAVINGIKYYDISENRSSDKSEELVKVFDLSSSKLEYEFTNNKSSLIKEVHFGNNNGLVSFLSFNLEKNGEIRILDLKSRAFKRSIKVPNWSIVTELNDTSILSLSSKSAFKYDIKGNTFSKVHFPLDSFKSSIPFGVDIFFHSSIIRSLSSNESILMTHKESVKIVNLSRGKIEATLNHPSTVTQLHLSRNETLLATVTLDGSTRIWDLSNKKELAELINYSDSDWLVKNPEGLFDGSPGAMKHLYFVNDLDIVDLAQLKERYYEPKLMEKILAGKPLRNTLGFKSIDLPPDIHVAQVDERGYLPIELTNRGGGIGEVAVYIQGKEVIKDARSGDVDPNIKSLKINYYIGNHKNLTKGDNAIGVKAWNKDHWVESRSKIIIYNKDEKESYQSAVHILTSGISDYAGGTEIDLSYAAKDAQDINKALRLGASKLFGTEKSYLYNLTTSETKDYWPTKQNILKAFERISLSSHPSDVIVVYLSGHGINVGGTDGDWHYLTQEAFSPSANAFNDPEIRKQTTISSNELVELFKTIPAAKQVLIIDACASGKVVENLISKKDIPSSTLRALDRMKDRTGLHIITGCTSDAVSYEASRYGQGVLTYSLLEGIRGAALREDEFVDVNKLFQYAQERVPVLAAGIGGIQSPVIFSPNGSQSFDIGQMTEVEKKEVPISKIRPVYIQSNFQDEDEMSDVLGLGKKVDQLLSESAAKGAEAQVIFVAVRDYPDGCQLVGRYKKENGKVFLKLKNKCEGKESTEEISGVDLNGLSNEVIKMILK